MPIGDIPLLEHWLQILQTTGCHRILVNLHYHAEIVAGFLDRPRFAGWVDRVFEPDLLGTAGTIRKNINYFCGHPLLLVHADNWCQCNFSSFIEYHQNARPTHCPITMMTFDTDVPESCGIVVTDDLGVVISFHEKIANPPSRRANAAVYLLEPEVLDWLVRHPDVTDFSTQVLPQYINRIATWHNTGIHRDIGTPSALFKAQQDPLPPKYWAEADDWQQWFLHHPVRQAIKNHQSRD
jgi:mannose-1-phosphate guanylyltransferase